MADPALYILLCSAEHERVQMAAMMASVGAVSERPVTLFVSMEALAVFAKQAPPEGRYRGGRFSRLMLEKGAPDALNLLQQGRELGELKIWACSMALDLHGWDIGDLVEDLFDGPLGLTSFLSDAESGQLITL